VLNHRGAHQGWPPGCCADRILRRGHQAATSTDSSSMDPKASQRLPPPPHPGGRRGQALGASSSAVHQGPSAVSGSSFSADAKRCVRVLLLCRGQAPCPAPPPLPRPPRSVVAAAGSRAWPDIKHDGPAGPGLAFRLDGLTRPGTKEASGLAVSGQIGLGRGRPF
jgi:hypothetical protein